MRTQLALLTNQQESVLEAPWQITNASEKYISVMIKAIVEVKIVITELREVMKLNKNKSDADASGAGKNLIKKWQSLLGMPCLISE
ncbi:FMN-binding negative transcriptional regulator [Yersinia kristensenii]|uniref:FMN-binding negative transcriptional regulator n=1 Tax=Yersinia kristensenii TaxID=28152 RepID=UPI003896E7E4